MANLNVAPPLPEPDHPHHDGLNPLYDVGPQDDYMRITEELDPHGELDRDHELLNACASYAYRMRKLYSGMHVEFPQDFLPKLYERELRYVIHGMDGINDLIQMNEAAGNKISVVNVLWDLDRSQVAVVDTFAGDDEMQHVPRPGWGFLIRKMDEAVKPARIEAGIVSDRPFAFDPSQTVNSSGHGLKDYAKKIFAEAGILSYLDDHLIISSTDGPVAERMRPHLQEAMRRKMRRDLSPVAKLHVESGQFDSISEILDFSQIGNKQLIYHPKVGVVTQAVLEARPDEVFVIIDDIESVQLIHSSRAVGIFIPPKLQPLLPDEGLLPEMLV